METTDNGDKLRKFIYDKYCDEKISNGDLVQILVLIFDLLNLKTINQFAKEYKKTYRGVLMYSKKLIRINKHKFIIDNH